MDHMNKSSLYIPQGLKTRVEIFNGYGKEELHKTILVTVVAGVIDGLCFLVFKNIVMSVVFMLVAIAGSVMMLSKDHSNVSVVDQVGFMIKFARSQKRFKYKYLDEWGWENNG